MADTLQPGASGPWVQLTAAASGHPMLVNMAAVAWVDHTPAETEDTARLAFIAGPTPMLHVTEGWEEIARRIGVHAVRGPAGGSDAAPDQDE